MARFIQGLLGKFQVIFFYELLGVTYHLRQVTSKDQLCPRPAARLFVSICQWKKGINDEQSRQTYGGNDFYFGCVCTQLLSQGPTLCSPMDCSPPGSFVHEILWARILEQVAISFSRGIFLTQGRKSCLQRLPHCQADSLPLSHPNNFLCILKDDHYTERC